MKIQRTIIKADIPTVQNVIFPKHILEENVNDYQELIDKKCSLGELGPISNNTAMIQLSNTSHIVTKLWMENNTVEAEIESINTPLGYQLSRFIEDKYPIAFKLRGLSQYERNTNGIIYIKYFKLIQLEAIIDPLCHDDYNGFLKMPKHKYRSIDEPWSIQWHT